MTDYSIPKNKLSRPKAMRAKCMDCCAGNRMEVRRCNVYTCPLFPYRPYQEKEEKKNE